MDLNALNIALREIAIGEMLMVMLVVVRSGATRAVRTGTALLLGGVIGYLVQSVAPAAAGTAWPGLVITVAANGAPLALWLFAHALFERQPDWRVAVAAGALLLGDAVVPMASAWCAPLVPWLDQIAHGVMALLALAALFVALVSREDDLNETRRRFAVAFVAIVASEALLVLLGEAWFGTAHEPLALRLAEAMLVIAAGLIVGSTLLQADLALIGALPRVAGLVADSAALTPFDSVLRDRLLVAMDQELWRESGLTIGTVAARLAVPEHRLRALINGPLGYRNFSAFLNDYRIGAARGLLADPGHVGLPVLTIAMDLGYGSLAPFNRAFREATGQTPTDYRRARFAEAEKS